MVNFLGGLRKEHEPPPAGRYQVKMIPKNLREAEGREGVTLYCTVEINDGELAGREVPLSFRVAGPDRQRFFVSRDVNALIKWADALGVTAAANGLDLLKELGRAGKDRALFMTFAVSSDLKFGPEILITNVEVAEPDV